MPRILGNRYRVSARSQSTAKLSREHRLSLCGLISRRKIFETAAACESV